jgi:hypothetical protein
MYRSSTVLFAFLSAALALGAPVDCAAEDAPELNLSLSSAAVDALNRDFEDDFRTLDAFGSGRRGIDRFPRDHLAAGNWKVYGRFFLVNFQNEIGNPTDTTRITWRRTGPSIKKSRIYIGFHRQF